MKHRSTLFMAAVLALPVLGAAQNPPTVPPPQAAPAAAPVVIGPAKVAFVNIQQVIFTCDEGKREATVLQQYIDKKNSELQGMQKELDGLKNKLDVQGSKLTDEARDELITEIETKDTNFQRFQEDTRKDIENRRTRLQNAIARKMLPVVEKVAKEKGLNVVQFLDTSNIYGYVDPGLVITDEIIKAYNTTYPATAVPTAPVKK